MDEYKAASQGGFRCLLSEALPTVSASTQIFANAPSGTAIVEFTILTQDCNLTFDATTATASVGNFYPKNGNYRFVLNAEQAKRVRAIQLAATTTGWISYFGIA